MLLRDFNVNGDDIFRKTPLKIPRDIHSDDHLKAIQILHDSGCDRYLKQSDILIDAIYSNKLEFVKQFLEWGYDLSLKNKEALRAAIFGNKFPTVRLLLEYGMDPNLGGDIFGGDSALVYSIKESKVEIAKLLIEYGPTLILTMVTLCWKPV